jgi:hypothetical protein
MPSLPALCDEPPQSGRLKSPQAMPYAHIACELLRREATGTRRTWHDVRKVTITVRGLKADVVRALATIQTVFNTETVLAYPSGSRFLRWWPTGSPKLVQDEATKDGQDVWQGILEAEVWSVRTY